jgi:DNA-binding XRE family transcriptional regulator
MALTGRDVAAARAKHQVTQAELAKYVGVARQIIIGIEKDRLGISQDGLKGWVIAVEAAAKQKEAKHG